MTKAAAMTDFDEATWAFLENEELEQTKDYLQRGRRFAGLDLESLKSAWVEAFRAFVADSDGEAGVVRHYDLEAEFRLRGEEKPTELVEAEQAVLDREMEEWLRDDPKSWDDMANSVFDEIVDFHCSTAAASKS